MRGPICTKLTPVDANSLDTNWKTSKAETRRCEYVQGVYEASNEKWPLFCSFLNVNCAEGTNFFIYFQRRINIYLPLFPSARTGPKVKKIYFVI